MRVNLSNTGRSIPISTWQTILVKPPTLHVSKKQNLVLVGDDFSKNTFGTILDLEGKGNYFFMEGPYAFGNGLRIHLNDKRIKTNGPLPLSNGDKLTFEYWDEISESYIFTKDNSSGGGFRLDPISPPTNTRDPSLPRDFSSRRLTLNFDSHHLAV